MFLMKIYSLEISTLAFAFSWVSAKPSLSTGIEVAKLGFVLF